MSKSRRQSEQIMLEAWRPGRDAGDPVGCLATTYTFDPGFFEEDCLARFLEIDSLPDREGLAYLLERENRLGPTYAGVLVDNQQAGVDHSLRWDVLPVRIPRGKQHSKLSLLAWNNVVRIVIASANLTQQGYRRNYEVFAIIDLTPQEANLELLQQSCEFLRRLLGFVPGASDSPSKQRATTFLALVQKMASTWLEPSQRGTRMSISLAATLPRGADHTSRSSLADCLVASRNVGNSPKEVRIASPFFDGTEGETLDETMVELCKGMARGTSRSLTLCVPPAGELDASARILAPRSLWTTATQHVDSVSVETLPIRDINKNARPWHAKMLSLSTADYTALMIGSSNFTKAGMGVKGVANAELNLVYVARHEMFAREARHLLSCWPETTKIESPEEAEWLGPQPELDEEESVLVRFAVPVGFLTVDYHTSEVSTLVVTLSVAELPSDWCVFGGHQHDTKLLDSAAYRVLGCPTQVQIPWPFDYAPGKLLVTWGTEQAFWSVNAFDRSTLPTPDSLSSMTEEELLSILAATDASAAFRVWARNKEIDPNFDEEMDSAVPPDIDALRRYRLDETFLHRVRHQARLLANLKKNIERPVFSEHALQWRLTGMIGVERLVERMEKRLKGSASNVSEVVLNLADLLIVLQDVKYEAGSGLSADTFSRIYLNFLRGLTDRLSLRVMETHDLSHGIRSFWSKVCRRTTS